MNILSSIAMYPGLWTVGASALLALVLLVNLRVPLRVVAAVLVLLPASPLLALRCAALAVVSMCDWMVADRPWSGPMVWAAHVLESHTNQEDRLLEL